MTALYVVAGLYLYAQIGVFVGRAVYRRVADDGAAGVAGTFWPVAVIACAGFVAITAPWRWLDARKPKTLAEQAEELAELERYVERR